MGILQLIQELTDADKCLKYKPQEFVPADQPNSNPKKKRKLTDNNSYEFTLAPIRINNNNNNNIPDQVEEIEDSSEDEAPKPSFGIVSSSGSTISLVNP